MRNRHNNLRHTTNQSSQCGAKHNAVNQEVRKTFKEVGQDVKYAMLDVSNTLKEINEMICEADPYKTLNVEYLAFFPVSLSHYSNFIADTNVLQ